MTTTPAPAYTRKHPRNPWIGFVCALTFLGAAIFGMVVFLLEWRNALSGDIDGQRSEGFVLFTPFLFCALGLMLLVRAIMAVRPWFSYRGETSLEQRRADKASDLGRLNGTWIILVMGVITLAGLLALSFAQPDTATGLALLWQIRMLLALGATVLICFYLQTLYYRRFLRAA